MKTTTNAIINRLHAICIRLHAICGVTPLVFLPENAVESLKLGQLCSSNCGNQVRSCDIQGCGYYGASRLVQADLLISIHMQLLVD